MPAFYQSMDSDAKYNNEWIDRVYYGNELFWEANSIITLPQNTPHPYGVYTNYNLNQLNTNIYSNYNNNPSVRNYLITGSSGSQLTYYTGAKHIYFNKDMSNAYNAFRANTASIGAPLQLTQFQDMYEYVENMYMAYYNSNNIKDAVCGPRVINFRQAFFNSKITGNVACGNNVIDMSNAYRYCNKLTGSPVCGDNVVNMSYTYSACYNLTGSPVCGDNVVDMSRAYGSCYNLTGSPVCGDNVINMYQVYWNCANLTGSPVCGIKVTNMSNTYYNCYSLTGAPICGPQVKDMINTYWNCSNLLGNMYMYSNNVANTNNMLYGHNASNIINIYTYAGSTTNRTLYSNKVGCGAWTLDATNNRYYNAANNIYVYYNWDGTNYDALV